MPPVDHARFAGFQSTTRICTYSRHLKTLKTLLIYRHLSCLGINHFDPGNRTEMVAPLLHEDRFCDGKRSFACDGKGLLRCGSWKLYHDRVPRLVFWENSDLVEVSWVGSNMVRNDSVIIQCICGLPTRWNHDCHARKCKRWWGRGSAICLQLLEIDFRYFGDLESGVETDCFHFFWPIFLPKRRWSGHGGLDRNGHAMSCLLAHSTGAKEENQRAGGKAPPKDHEGQSCWVASGCDWLCTLGKVGVIGLPTPQYASVILIYFNHLLWGESWEHRDVDVGSLDYTWMILDAIWAEFSGSKMHGPWSASLLQQGKGALALLAAALLAAALQLFGGRGKICSQLGQLGRISLCTIQYIDIVWYIDSIMADVWVSARFETSLVQQNHLDHLSKSCYTAAYRSVLVP